MCFQFLKGGIPMRFSIRVLWVAGMLFLGTGLLAGPFDGRRVVVDPRASNAASMTPAVPPNETIELCVRVASYNIAHARGNEEGKAKNEIARKENLDGIANLLKSHKIDVAGFTEISKGDLRAKFRNQPKYLAEHAGGMHFVYAENYRRAFGLLATQGNAILSKFPIVWSQNHKLYRSDEKHEQRGCLEALLDLGNDRRLRVLVAHLSLEADESTKQIEEIWDMARKSREPVLLLGDFNSRPKSDRVKWLSSRMKDTTSNVNTTFLNKPDVKIDYIFTHGPVRAGTAFVDGFTQGYSDHGCLINEFRIAYPKK